MQALIDFDGWRKWKDFSQTKPANAEKKALGANNIKSPSNNKSPKAALNGKAQSTPKRDRMSILGKETTGSDGTGTDTLSNGDSGSGNEAILRG